MIKHVFWILACVSVCVARQMRFTPVVSLQQGNIQGLEDNRGNYRKYLGIPYGTFKGRFAECGPAPTWTGTFNATENRVTCPQYHERLGIPLGDENCFTLNIFTPGQLSYKKLLPVMFFIHGGGYMMGNNNELFYNPEPIVRKNIVVVTINYRVGAFGFLCLRIKGAPGNVGLKDQLSALKWVNENIKMFGGDPQSVTMFGEDAGSASVNYFILSKEAKGLFHRAIMQSGTVLSPYAFGYDPVERASLVAAKMGYNTKNPYELERIFKNASISDIVLASVVDKSMNPISTFIFRPCVEKQVSDGKPFLTKTPKQILESDNYYKIPVIIGYNNKEGIFHVKDYEKSWYQDLDEHFEDVVPDNIYFASDNDKVEIGRQAKNFYYGNISVTEEMTDSLIDFFSDAWFHYPCVAVAEYFTRSNKATVFTYYFQYDSKRNIRKETSDLDNQKGAAHSDELFYLFQPVVTTILPKSKKDAAIIDRMTSLWSNHARTGDPSSLRSPSIPIKWYASENGTLRFLVIDENIQMTSLPNQRRIDFWKSIYSKYGYA